MLLRNIMAKLSSVCRHNSGAAIVEFALIIPIFMLVVMAIIQFGVVLYVENVALNAAREASRGLSVGEFDEASAKDWVDANLPGWISSPQIDISIDRGEGNIEFYKVSMNIEMSDASIIDPFKIFSDSSIDINVSSRVQ